MMTPFILPTSSPVEVLTGRIQALAEDERLILESLLARLELGRRQYGPWIVDDGRDYPAEAYEEVLDSMHYCAAALVRQRRLAGCRRRRVYVCHPFADNPPGNVESVRKISRRLLGEGVLPVAPHLYLPAFLDEGTERELALSFCVELLDICDEVRVFGATLTSGMGREIERAKQRGIPIHFEPRTLP